MIARRAVLRAIFALALLATPLTADTQQPAGKVYRLGYLSTGSATATYLRPLEAFREELRELGWVEGRNLVIEYRYAEGRPDRLPGLAEELVGLKVDVIATGPTPATVAARNATRTIPIVGMGLTEPVALGLVASLTRPGGNVTGVTYSVDTDIFGKQLALLKEVVPNVRRVAVLWNPTGSPAFPLTMSSVQAAARSLGLVLQPHEAPEPGEFDGAFAAMAKERTVALLVFGDPMFFLHRARLADLALKKRLPSMSTQWQWVEAGGLMSYGPSLPDLWRRAEGQNIVIEWRFAGGRAERLPDLAAELVRLRVEVIVVPSTPTALAAKNATATIPLVTVGGHDPVALGLVTSLARPGGNIIGLTISLGPEIAGRQLELLKQAVPRVPRLAVLWNPTTSGNAVALREAESAARTIGVELQILEARSVTDFENAFAAMNAKRAGALFVLGDVMFLTHRTRLAELAAKSRLPAMYAQREFVDDRGLMSYGAKVSDNFRRAATYVDKILKGAKPAELPIERPTKFALVINLRTVKALGLNISPSLLQRADEVIE